MRASDRAIPKAPRKEPGQRRALSHVGGKVAIRAGATAVSETLRGALEVTAGESRVQAHVHGFHSYPARLHPDTARRLIADWSSPRDTVLDLFCGSGTVVIEARTLGRRAVGSDLSPLAIELTRLKATGASPRFVEALRSAATKVQEHAQARKQAEVGPSERYGAEDRELFATHVLLELDGLRHGIDQLKDPGVARALRMVHSALLGKLCQRPGDSSGRIQPKRTPGGFAIRFFGMKVDELGRRLLEFAELVPRGTPLPRVHLSDARRLTYLDGESVALIVSSPPYPGVYDYHEQHRLRLRWLRLDANGLRSSELGARRFGQKGAAAANAEWRRGFTQCLREIRRVLRPDGRAALVVADSVLGGRPFPADRWLPPLSEDAGLVVVGHATQERPYFHGPTQVAFATLPRREHLFVLGKLSHAAKAQPPRRRGQPLPPPTRA